MKYNGTLLWPHLDIKEINIPSFIKRIGSCSFSSCKLSIKVTISPSVTSVGHYACKGCWLLGQIAILSSVTSIGYYASKETYIIYF